MTRSGDSAIAMAQLGVTLVQEGDMDIGVALLEKATSLDARGDLLANLAVAYVRAGREQDAERAFQRALAVAPNDRLLQEDADIFLRMRQGRLTRESVGDAEYRRRVQAEKEAYTAEYKKEASRPMLMEESCAVWEHILERARELERAATGGADFFEYIARGARGRRPSRILSLASGPGGVELGLARTLGPETIIECIEINEALVALGTERARRDGLNVRFSCQDINTLRLEAKSYDVIMAHAALHHFLALEHIFSEVHAALKMEGEFVVNDVTSKNGYELWPETKAVIGHLWALLPERLRTNRTLYAVPTVDTEYPDRNYLGNGFECVRSQDILPLLHEHFRVVHYVPYFAIARRFFDRMFGPNFDLGKPFDRAVVDFIWQLDCELVRSQAARPETAFLVLRRRDTPEAIARA